MRPPLWIKKLAQPFSDALVFSSTAYVQIKSQLNQLSPVLIDFDASPLDSRDDRLLEFVRAIRPMTSGNLELQRVGGPNDGGYVMASPLTACAAISIGIGPDVSWDQDVASRGIPVAMFDPTIRRLPSPVSGGRFFRMGIGSNSQQGKYRSLEDLLTVADIPQDGELLLKIDVEGAEWDSLRNVPAALLQRFTQIVLEFHGIEDLATCGGSANMLALVGKLRSSHMPVHVHANNYSPIVRFGNYWFPSTVEVSYLRRELLQDPSPAASCASHLDAPCDPRVAEISLSGLFRLAV